MEDKESQRKIVKLWTKDNRLEPLALKESAFISKWNPVKDRNWNDLLGVNNVLAKNKSESFVKLKSQNVTEL